ncbi:MAG: hypothetical protein ACTHLE_09000 [Agriterribacter sp.]
MFAEKRKMIRKQKMPEAVFGENKSGEIVSWFTGYTDYKISGTAIGIRSSNVKGVSSNIFIPLFKKIC